MYRYVSVCSIKITINIYMNFMKLETQKRVLEWLGVITAIFYSLFVAANINLEFFGFALLLISAMLLGVWAWLCKHRGMLLLQFFYAAAGILGMVRWFGSV